MHIEHDGNAGALAEFHFGAGRARPGLRHLVFLTFGTGLGAGFIVNGRILHGASDTAGEIGHWRLAATALKATANAAPGRVSHPVPDWCSWRHSCIRSAGARTPIRTLVEAMLRDEPDALAVATAAGERMGQGLALIVDALNPATDRAWLTGSGAGRSVLEPARAVVAREALPQAAAACPIVPAALGAGIGDVAAFMAALTDARVRARLGLSAVPL